MEHANQKAIDREVEAILHTSFRKPEIEQIKKSIIDEDNANFKRHAHRAYRGKANGVYYGRALIHLRRTWFSTLRALSYGNVEAKNIITDALASAMISRLQ